MTLKLLLKSAQNQLDTRYSSHTDLPIKMTTFVMKRHALWVSCLFWKKPLV